MILGVIGPWQIIAILVFLAILAGVVLLIVFIVRSTSKPSVENNDKLLEEKKSQDKDKFEVLERLNKLRESGALTDEEFEAEKKKVLG